MIERACVRCGRIGCQKHKEKAWQGSDRRKRLPKSWRKTRRAILLRDPICKDGRRCNNLALSKEVDHIIPNDDHSPENLQGICVECHRAKSSEEGNRAKR